jgi:transcriptional regulator SbtR-like protein
LARLDAGNIVARPGGWRGTGHTALLAHSHQRPRCVRSFLRLAGLIRVKHGLGEALNTAGARDVIDATYAPVLAAIRRLLDTGEQAGELRPSLDERDVLLLMSCVWRVPAGAAGQAQAERLLDTVIDPLRPHR